jgi:hypothetical protein
MVQSYNITVAKANSQRTNWNILSLNPTTTSFVSQTPCN